MNEEKIIACVITFNPDIATLKKCLLAVAGQVDEIVIWDNNSANICDIKYFIDEQKCKKYSVWEHSDNHGIAQSLNNVFSYAEKNDYRWILTLDQDSIVPDNMIEEYRKYIDKPNIAIIGCRTVDRNLDDDIWKGSDVDVVGRLITSGSLNNIEAWKCINGFDEKLFIDSVDTDYNINLINNGYVLLRVNSVPLSHAIGNIKSIKFAGKKLIIYNHSAKRKYYQIRNMFYLDRKYKKFYRLFALTHLIIGIIKIVLFESNKLVKLKASFMGAIDGMKL